MEEQLEFLKEKDSSILEAEIIDVVTKDGESTVGISLMIGMMTR